MNPKSYTPKPSHAATLEALDATLDQLADDAARLVHQLHFLNADLDWSLDRSRGQSDHVGIRFYFQSDNIDATLWLVGEAWNTATNLKKRIEANQKALDEIREWSGVAA